MLLLILHLNIGKGFGGIVNGKDIKDLLERYSINKECLNVACAGSGNKDLTYCRNSKTTENKKCDNCNVV